MGFKDVGYEYVNSDDCWSNVFVQSIFCGPRTRHLLINSIRNGRDNQTLRLLPNMTKFPEGISGVAEKIHSMGLKMVRTTFTRGLLFGRKLC